MEEFIDIDIEELKGRPRLSGWWWFALGVSFFVTALVFRLVGLVAGVFCALIALVLLINLGRPFRKFRRIVYVIIVPGVLTAVLVASVLRIPEIADILRATPLRFIVSGPEAIAFWPVVIGLIAGFLAPLLIISIYVLLNIDQLTSFTSLEAKEARRVLISILLNVNYPYMVIKDGEEKETKPQGILSRLGGPGLVIIHPNSAVVFERGDKLTKVELGGFVTTERFERPGKIIDLRPQSANQLVEDVLTKDGVPLKIELRIFYQIRRQGEQILSEPYPVQKRDVFKAAYNVNDWKAATEFLGYDILRDVVAELNLDEVYEVDPRTGKPIARASIKKEVMDRLNKMTLTWGTEITWVDIGKIEMPEEAREQLLEKWTSKAKAETLGVIETAKARAESQMIAAVGEALKVAGASAPALVLLRFFEAMKKMSEDPSTKFLFPYGLPFQDVNAIKSLLEKGEEGKPPPSLPPSIDSSP